MAIRNRQAKIVLGALASGLCLHPAAARSEIIKFDDMRRGSTVTSAQCAALPTAVYVQAFGRRVCMRYYFSDAGGTGSQATFFLNGDKGTVIGGVVDPNGGKDLDTASLDKAAHSFSKTMGQPVVYMARMGLDGSSGYHAQRRTKLELAITNAAIEAIKARHGFTSINIFGQSGGGTLVGSLIPLRHDINCAVPGSGGLAPPATTLRHPPADPAMHKMNPMGDVPSIVRTSKARIMVVTDPNDQAVPRAQQDPFVQGLRAAGRKVEQFYVTAKDDKHHGVVKYALVVTHECVRGSSAEQIASALANPEPKTRIAEPAPRRDPDRQPERQARPADPPRPSPPAADPTTPPAPPKVCQWFLTQLGVYMDVPCDMVTASK